MGKLSFIIGRSKSGKTRRILELASEPTGNPKLLIVPDQATLLYESELVEALETEGFIDVEVISFSNLLESLCDENGLGGSVVLGKTGKAMILKKVIGDMKSAGEYFGRSGTTFSFLDRMSATIDEFKMSGVTPELLDESISAIEDESVKFKLREISKVYSGYEERLESVFLDEGRLSELGADWIQSGGRFRGADVFIDGFHIFSHGERRMVEAMIMSSNSVAVALLVDSDGESSEDAHIFEPALSTMKSFERFALENRIETGCERMRRNTEGQAGDMIHLERNAFAWPGMAFDGDVESIRIMKCKDIFDEVSRVGDAISGLLRDKGARMKGIAVICGDLGLYGPVVKRMFGDYGLPVFIDDKRSIMYYPVVKAIMGALESISRNYMTQPVLKLLKSGMFDLRQNAIEKLEIHAIENGIRFSKWLQPIDDEELEDIRRSVMDPLAKLKEALRGEKSAKDISRALYGYMKSMSFPEIVNKKMADLYAAGDYETALEYSQSWNGAIDVMEQLVESMAGEAVSVEEYLELLKDGFRTHRAGVLPTSRDRIVVGDMERTILGRVDHMFILGFCDGSIPGQAAGSSMISSREKELLRKHGVKLMGEPGETSNLQSLKIYTSITSPESSLTISFPLSGIEGEATPPSLIIERLFLSKDRMFPKIEVEGVRLGDDNAMEMGSVNSPVATLKSISRRMGGCHIEGDVIAAACVSAIGHDPAHRGKVDSLSRGLNYTNEFNHVDPAISAELFSGELSASVSRLEKFRKCPFSHLVSYGLRPGEVKEYEIANTDLGNVYHTVLERYGREHLMGRIDFNDEESQLEDAIGRIVTEEVESLLSKGRVSRIFLDTGLGRYAIKKITRYSVTTAMALLDHMRQGSFRPSMLEAKFGSGPDADLKHVEIDCGDGRRVILEGRIDRIDVASEDGEWYCRVIDYKSGSSGVDASEIVEGVKLQLANYLSVAVENGSLMGDEAMKPGGAFYFRISDPIVSRDDADAGDVASDVKNSLSMTGIAACDQKALQANDSRFADEESSDKVDYEIIADLRKELRKMERKGSTRVFTSDELSGLLAIARKKSGEIGRSIMDGYASIKPLKHDGKVACQYCDYSSICQFDTSLSGNRYDTVKKRSAEEIREMAIRAKRGEKGE